MRRDVLHALTGAQSEPFVVTRPEQARALVMWFGRDWAGNPARPAQPGPEAEAALLVHMARDVATIAAGTDAARPRGQEGPVNWHGLQMRAIAARNAQADPAPVGLRRGFHRDEVQIHRRELPHAGYFDLEEVTLTHPTFAGGRSEIVSRSCLRAADAVTVLPYDPVTDRVLIVEQFRPAAFSRGDPHPWVLEPVAGRVDCNEAADAVARREAQEEAGLTLTALEKIAGYYPSPGTLVEYLTSFVGICDLSQASGGIHGLDEEAEDIRSHVLSFAEAFDLIESGEADNGPLLLSLYWLAANRDRLRAGV